MVEMACKLRDEKIDVILLMGNNDIFDAKKDEKSIEKGFFFLLKKELGQNFEFE